MIAHSPVFDQAAYNPMRKNNFAFEADFLVAGKHFNIPLLLVTVLPIAPSQTFGAAKRVPSFGQGIKANGHAAAVESVPNRFAFETHQLGAPGAVVAGVGIAVEPVAVFESQLVVARPLGFFLIASPAGVGSRSSFLKKLVEGFERKARHDSILE